MAERGSAGTGRDGAHEGGVAGGGRTGGGEGADGDAAGGHAHAAGRGRAGPALRAAAGRAAAGSTARRVLLLVGSGDNGGDALYAGARLARAGRRGVRRCCSRPERVHAAGLAALRAAGGRPVRDLPATVDLVARRHRRHRRQRRAARRRGRAGRARCRAARTRRARRPPVVAVDVPSGVAVDTGDVPRAPAVTRRRDGHLRLPQAGARGRAGRRRWPARSSWSTSGCAVAARATRRSGCRTRPTSPTGGRGPAPASDKYTRGVVGVATGSRDLPGRGAAVGRRARWPGRPAWSATPGSAARRRRCARTRRWSPPRRVADAGRVQAWVCGSGLGTDDGRRHELRAVLGRPGAGGAGRRRADPAGRRLARRPAARRDAPTVVTPHDREFARLAGEQPGADRVGAGAAAGRLDERGGAAQGRPHGRGHAGRAGVGQSDRHAGAGHGGHRRRAGRAARLAAGGRAAGRRAAVAAAYLHGLAGRRGGAGRAGDRAGRGGRAASGARRLADRRRLRDRRRSDSSPTR